MLALHHHHPRAPQLVGGRLSHPALDLPHLSAQGWDQDLQCSPPAQTPPRDPSYGCKELGQSLATALPRGIAGNHCKYSLSNKAPMPRPAWKGGAQLGIWEEGHPSPFLRGKKVFFLCSLKSKQSTIFGTINKCWHSHGGAGKGHGGGGSIPRDESHPGIPTGSPVGTNTCMSWIWAPHRHPPYAHSHEVCQLYGSDR